MYYYIVYKTTNLVNGKYYIGFHKTKTPYEFDGYYGSGKSFLLAFNKYGKENFKRETLFIFNNPKDALAKEREIVNEDFIKRKDNYNCVIGGDAPWTNQKHSEESKTKISESLKRTFREHPEIIETLIKKRLGTKKSKETREKISESNKGKHLTEETKKKLSEAQKNNWSTNEEFREKMLESLRSNERKEKISKALTGLHHWWQDKINKNPEKIRKMAETHRGMKRSEESKKRMSEARKKAFANGLTVHNKIEIPPKEDLYFLIHEKKFPKHIIQKMMNVSDVTLLKWRKHYGI